MFKSNLPLRLNPACSHADNEVFVSKLQELEKVDLRRITNRLINKSNFEPSRAEQARVEFLQFISLLYISDGSYSPSNLADEFWHAFILHTHDYAAFCQKFFGRFIHHEPFDTNYPPPEGRAVNSRRLIERIFIQDVNHSNQTLQFFCTLCEITV